MILGLDVGGTQTDAVVLENGQVRAHTKTVNRPELLETLGQSLDKTLAGIEPDKIQRMVFSTTDGHQRRGHGQHGSDGHDRFGRTRHESPMV